MVAIQHQLAQILGPAFRRNRPHHIGEQIVAQGLRRRHLVDVDLNLRSASLAVYSHLAHRLRHVGAAFETNDGGALPMVIIDRLDGLRNHGRTKDRNAIA